MIFLSPEVQSLKHAGSRIYIVFLLFLSHNFLKINTISVYWKHFNFLFSDVCDEN